MEGDFIMSTKEIAYTILDNLNEEQLKAFVALFKDYYPNEDIEQARRDEAFRKLESMRKRVIGLDDKKELAEYREEKYGY